MPALILHLPLFSLSSRTFYLLTTVDSRYLEVQWLWNTSRYPYLDISDLRTRGKINQTTTFNKWYIIWLLKLEIYWKYCGKEEKLLPRSKYCYLLLDFHVRKRDQIFTSRWVVIRDKRSRDNESRLNLSKTAWGVANSIDYVEMPRYVVSDLIYAVCSDLLYCTLNLELQQTLLFFQERYCCVFKLTSHPAGKHVYTKSMQRHRRWFAIVLTLRTHWAVNTWS